MDTLSEILSSSKIADEIYKARTEGRFKFIEYSNIKAGFLIWREKVKDGILHIKVGSMFIDPAYRKKISLLPIRTFLRNKYPGAILWWTRKKYNKRLSIYKGEKYEMEMAAK